MKVLQALRDDGPMAIEIHKLASQLWNQVGVQGLKTVLVTSALRGEGKSTTVSYLAAAVALSSNRKILAMDLDFRAPRLSTHLGLESQQGLADLLQGDCDLEGAITHTELPNLDVIFPAKEEADPNLLVNFPRLRGVVESLRERYDLILLDGPAMIPVADSSCFLPLSDGVILVVMAGRTSKPHLARARDICLGMGANLLGAIVTNSQEAAPDLFSSDYYHAYPLRESANGQNEPG